MASYCKITLVGNVTRDPELRTVGDAQLARFGLAVSRKTKQGDEVTFFDIAAWRKLGEICVQYLHKGDSVLIAGRLNIRKYTNKDGIQATAVEVEADEMQMLGGKKRDHSGGDYGRPVSSSAKSYDDKSDPFDDTEIPF